MLAALIPLPIFSHFFILSLSLYPFSLSLSNSFSFSLSPTVTLFLSFFLSYSLSPSLCYSLSLYISLLLSLSLLCPPLSLSYSFARYSSLSAIVLISPLDVIRCPYWADVCMYLPNPSHEQDVTEDQLFKQSLTGLNSKFSFPKTGCNTKVKEPSLPPLTIAGGKIVGYYHHGIRKQPRPGFELGFPCPFPTTIAIIPRTSDNNETSIGRSKLSWLSGLMVECTPADICKFLILG